MIDVVETIYAGVGFCFGRDRVGTAVQSEENKIREKRIRIKDRIEKGRRI